MAKLRIVAGEKQGTEFELGRETAVLGRRASCAIHLQDAGVSRSHAEINSRGGQYYLHDLDSANGTFVNAIPLTREKRLERGDEIRVGSVTLRFFADEAQGPEVYVPGYQIEEVIAQGGMGTVYRAVQVSMDRYVALKVLHSHFASRKDFVQRFVQEARAAGKLNHPNIISVHDVGKAGETYYFSMELVSGNDLSQIMGYRTLEHPELMEIAAKVCDALDYAHRNGIVHRDIKPENIMLAENGEVKLADLGIAKTFEAEEAEEGQKGKGKVLGTPHYMSPEQASNDRVDGRTDLYSLGATLYHIFSGAPPFEGESNREIMLKHLNEEPEPLRTVAPQVPKKVADVIETMMAKKPEDRYAGAAEAAEALRAAATAKARPGPATLRPGRPAGGRQSTNVEATARVRPARPRRGTGGGSGHGAQVAVFLGVLLVALLGAWLVANRGEGEEEGPRGPTAEEILQEGRALQEEGNLQAALDRYNRVIDFFHQNPDAQEDAARYAERVREQMTRRRREERAEEAWEAFAAWRRRHPDDRAALAERLDRLAEAHGALLAERLEAAREELARAREAAAREAQEERLRAIKERVDEVDETLRFDPVLQALADFREEYPETPFEADVELMEERVRAAALTAAGRVRRRAEEALERGRYPAALKALEDFCEAAEAEAQEAELRTLQERVESAMRERRDAAYGEVRKALRDLDFGAAEEALQETGEELAGTAHAAELKRRREAVEQLAAFHEGFVVAVNEAGLRQTEIRVREDPTKREALRIAGAKESGLLLPLGGNAQTTLLWEKIRPAEMLQIYRLYADPQKADHRRALQTYAGIYGLED